MVMESSLSLYDALNKIHTAGNKDKEDSITILLHPGEQLKLLEVSPPRVAVRILVPAPICQSAVVLICHEIRHQPHLTLQARVSIERGQNCFESLRLELTPAAFFCLTANPRQCDVIPCVQVP